jgi:hypothetical protein
MQSTMSLQMRHSSGICSFEERSLKYPGWYWHPAGFSPVLVFSLTSGCIIFGSSASLIFSSAFSGASSTIFISVRQKGHAKYVSDGFSCKFKVLRGAVKFFLHVGFWHVSICFSPCVLIITIAYSIYSLLPYSFSVSLVQIANFSTEHAWLEKQIALKFLKEEKILLKNSLVDRCTKGPQSSNPFSTPQAHANPRSNQ